MIKGSLVALVTPMLADGRIDEKSLVRLLDWHLQSQTDAIIIAGTTGESASLTREEYFFLIQFIKKYIDGRMPIIVGTGSNNTIQVIELTQRVAELEVDAALIVTPYYIKPSQRGLYAHYATIAEHTELPIILYNVPGRTACDLLPETIEQLHHISNIVGIKEATGQVERICEIRERCGKEFLIYSGDDITALTALQKGADGVISVTANVMPKEMHDLCEAVFSKNSVLIQQLNSRLEKLHPKLFVESNPVPVKWVLNQMGMIDEGIRLPLLPLDKKYHAELNEVLKQIKVKFF